MGTVKTFAMLVFVASAPTGLSQTPAPRVRDSSGVRIVEIASIKVARVAFVIGVRPTLDLGGLKDDPDHELESSAPFLAVKKLSDGRYVTVNNSTLKLFDSHGKFVRSIGRRGKGPGEFNQVREVCIGRGDTLVGVGYGDRRVSVFDSTGHLVRTFSTDGSGWADPCFADGTVLIATRNEVNAASPLPPSVAAVFDRLKTVTRYSLLGNALNVVGQFPAGAEASFLVIGNVVVRNDSLYVGDGQLSEVSVYSSDGRLSRVIRWDDPRTRMTDELFRNNLMFEPRGGGAPDQMARFNEQIRQAPKPTYFPAYGTLKVDPVGRIWVEDYPLKRSDPRGWTVFNANGSLLGRVSIPALPGADSFGVELGDIERDYVVLRWRDKRNGAAHLSFHPLTPR